MVELLVDDSIRMKPGRLSVIFIQFHLEKKFGIKSVQLKKRNEIIKTETSLKERKTQNKKSKKTAKSKSPQKQQQTNKQNRKKAKKQTKTNKQKANR